MNFDHEGWRPIYKREPVSQRAWTLVTRGLRAYLLGRAEDDGTLLKRCADPSELAAALGVHDDEAELVRDAIDTLLQDGFLQWEGDAKRPAWLGIDRLVTFDAPPAVGVDAAEPPADRRKRLARERQTRARERSRGPGERDLSRGPSVTESVTGCVTPSVTGCVTGSVTERDTSRLPPQSPPSERDKNTGENKELFSGSGSRAGSVTERDRVRDTERDRQRDTSRVTERDASCVTAEVIPIDHVGPGRARGPQPEPSRGADTHTGTWWYYPEGWHWNAETEAAASVVGVSAKQLQDHVDYWTTHVFSRPVCDLDGELRRSIGGIRTRAETARAKAAQAPFRPRKPAVLAQPNCGMTVESIFARKKPAEAAQ